MNELHNSQAFREHQAHPISTPYERVVKFCSKWVLLAPKGPRPFFGPFLKFGQAIVDAIFVQKISNFW
jgi:hypothetical protein